MYFQILLGFGTTLRFNSASQNRAGISRKSKVGGSVPSPSVPGTDARAPSSSARPARVPPRLQPGVVQPVPARTAESCARRSRLLFPARGAQPLASLSYWRVRRLSNSAETPSAGPRQQPAAAWQAGPQGPGPPERAPLRAPAGEGSGAGRSARRLRPPGVSPPPTFRGRVSHGPADPRGCTPLLWTSGHPLAPSLPAPTEPELELLGNRPGQQRGELIDAGIITLL